MANAVNWIPVVAIPCGLLVAVAIWLLWLRRQENVFILCAKWLVAPPFFSLLFVLVLGGEPIDNLMVGCVVGFTSIHLLQAFDHYFDPRRPKPTSMAGHDILKESEGVAWIKSDRELFSTCKATIGRIPIPAAAEPMGFLFSGSPGSGKTQAFIQLANSARERGQPAVIADLGAEYLSMFYRKTKDIIYNPFDQRSVDWSPFAEMGSAVDAIALTWSMVPEGTGSSKEWHFYSRTILYVVLVRLFKLGKPTNGALCYYLLTAPLPELAELCKGSVAAPYFELGNERMLGSVRAILCTYLQPYMHLKPDVGSGGYSIKKFVRSKADSWMFLTYREDQLKALRPLLAAQLDIASSALLSSVTDLDNRLWFFLDEAYALGFVDSMVSLVSLGRKKGGCPVLGLQSITQLEEVYGKEKTETILNCLKNTLMLYQSSNKNEDHMINLLGERKFVEVTPSKTSTFAGGKMSRSTSMTSQIKTEKALIKGQLRDLDPLKGILKLDGRMPPTRICIPIATNKQDVTPFRDVKEGQSIDIAKPTMELPEQPSTVPSTYHKSKSGYSDL